MPAASLIALIDDIATVLDDVALLGRIAAKKTAGVLGDDLALNAQQVTGFAAEREIPVVLAVARGSLVNKAILVPLALAISALAPWAITPLLMAGGLFLCFEGVEKLAHRWLHRDEAEAHDAELRAHVADTATDLATLEKERVQGAIRTDFILSAEIIVIALGTVAGEPMLTRVLVLAGVALLMTVGVYGLVAGIVKLDDLGLHWQHRSGGGAFDRTLRAAGGGLLVFAPWLMKALAVAGTVAMFLVGGGIALHGWPAAHHALLAAWPLGDALTWVLDGAFGVAAGAVVLALVEAARRLRP
jgi:predicted DNA repair protein MutK